MALLYIWLKVVGQTHERVRCEMAAELMGFNCFFDYQEYIEEHEGKCNDLSVEFEQYFENTSDNTIYEGRYWYDNNIIIFWGKTPPRNKLYEILKQIDRVLNINIYETIVVVNDSFIPFKKYDFNYDNNVSDADLRAIHLMNQKDKRDALSDFRDSRSEFQGKKLGNMTMAQYHNLIYQEGKDFDTILENFELEVEPDEVDLSSFELEDSLNREIWNDNNELNPRIRLKLLDIADDFFNSLEVNFVKPIDIILTGSLCNYNWSEFSDIDLHIIVNFDEISEKTEFVKEYFDSKKNEWNNEHKELKIFDFPIELYVQNSNDYGISNGVYSLERNKWIKVPNIGDLEPLNDVSSDNIKKVASSIMTKIDDYFDYFAECSDNHKLEVLNQKIDNLLYKIKKYREKSLKLQGETRHTVILYIKFCAE